MAKLPENKPLSGANSKGQTILILEMSDYERRYFFDNYSKLIVEAENGEKIAEVTNELVTPADGYVVRLTPTYS
jgi:hypothetical protein